MSGQVQVQVLTPRQAARALGVSESSLKRWCDQGQLRTERTPGGHRRISLASLLTFARQRGRPLSPAAALGGMSAGGRLENSANLRARLLDGLIGADLEALRRIASDAYSAGSRLVDICDTIVAPAFHELGKRWADGQVHVYHERAATQVAQAGLSAMESLLPPPAEEAPLALCAALNGDPYSIVVSMLRVCLREAGWRVVSLGADMPAAALGQALSDLRPWLLALSVSSVADEPAFLGEYRSLRETAIEHGTALALGGRALTASLRRSIRYDFFGETLDHLVSFADGLTRRRD